MIETKWRGFPLHPEIPQEGIALKALFAKMPVDVDEMMQRLKKTAADLGLPFGERKMTFNSRLAQELGLWAESKGKGDPFHLAVFKAYFADGENIGKIPVLLDLSESVGLPREEAAAVCRDRTFSERVDADWRLAREKGITAVPTFVIGDQKIVGAQPYETLETAVKANRADRSA